MLKYVMTRNIIVIPSSIMHDSRNLEHHQKNKKRTN